MRLIISMVVLCFSTACTSDESLKKIQPLSQTKHDFVVQNCYESTKGDFSDSFQRYMDDKMVTINHLKQQANNDDYRDVLFALNHFSDHWDRLMGARNDACEQWAKCEYLVDSKRLDQQVCANRDIEFGIARIKLITFFNYIEQISLSNKTSKTRQ